WIARYEFCRWHPVHTLDPLELRPCTTPPWIPKPSRIASNPLVLRCRSSRAFLNLIYNSQLTGHLFELQPAAGFDPDSAVKLKYRKRGGILKTKASDCEVSKSFLHSRTSLL